MSRRPKLNLSSDNNTHKKQALGFESAVPADQTDAMPETSASAPEDLGVQDATSGLGKTAPQASAWPVNRKWVKVVLVAVAAALSLYLLKRRLL